MPKDYGWNRVLSSHRTGSLKSSACVHPGTLERILQLIPRMIFALFEEWGWCGYLEPRFVASGVPDIRRHVFVGSVWALWYFPLILSTAYTDIPYAIYFPFFVVAVILTAIVYGQLRKASGTVWTSVVIHGIGNAFGWAILQDDLLTFNNTLLANPAPESILSIVLIGALGGWMLYKSAALKERAGY